MEHMWSLLSKNENNNSPDVVVEFELIPKIIWTEIFKLLNISSIINFSKVNHFCRSLVQENQIIWKYLFQKHWPHENLEVLRMKGKSWDKLFQEYYTSHIGTFKNKSEEPGLFGRITRFFRKKKEVRALLIGLDAAGKTTILYKLKFSPQATVPSIGFQVETLIHKNVNYTVWDVPGSDKIRPLWKHYLVNLQGLIYVVDSCDRERFQESSTELFKLLEEDSLKGFNIPVLIFANKQDLPNAATLHEIVEEMHFEKLTQNWYVQKCCATTGDGLFEGLEWFHSQLWA